MQEDRSFCEGCPYYAECESPCPAYEDTMLWAENETNLPEEEI